MKTLYLIPARGGSKGIPHKNIKLLSGKPLIYYTIDIARRLADDKDICVSTDDDEIINTVEEYGLHVLFKRPDALATDKCGTYKVILQALDFYKNKGEIYDAVVLLQPTSPFRTVNNVSSCIERYLQEHRDMVASVKESSTNPYYNCFKVDNSGTLEPLFNEIITRRQDAPKTYEYNGAVYVMNVEKLREKSYEEFNNIGYAIMDELSSVDLDTIVDWKFAEMIISENLINHGY
jgi:CMP-N-acetylneuraminic acid synthetase